LVLPPASLDAIHEIDTVIGRAATKVEIAKPGSTRWRPSSKAFAQPSVKLKPPPIWRERNNSPRKRDS
jgi:hypothetical protein